MLTILTASILIVHRLLAVNTDTDKELITIQLGCWPVTIYYLMVIQK